MAQTLNLAAAIIIVLIFGTLLHRLAYIIGSNSIIIKKISNFLEKILLKIFSKLDNK